MVEAVPIEVNLALCLPQDTQTVPLVRHLVGATLEEFHVTATCRGDVELAVTEACANVLHHSRTDDEFEVQVSVDPQRCVLRVVDTGRGFDFATLDEPDPTGDRGRGIQLMKALVDNIHFDSRPEVGTIVHFVKQLELEPGAPF
jgi:serine/threonine-protein kinase RsbW